MVTDHSGVREVAQADWIIAHPIEPDVALKLLLREVDRGEAEAIGLAVQLKADVLLIDERQARQLAQYLELNVVGLLDVLHEAKQRQLIPLIKPVLDDLLTHARFRVSRKLYQHTLQTAGELNHAHLA
jgi:predicted nucleic acid-binding protein